MSDIVERLRTYQYCLAADQRQSSASICKLVGEAADTIEQLRAQVEALQNKCANRGLSPEDSDKLQAENSRLREAIKNELAFAADDECVELREALAEDR